MKVFTITRPVGSWGDYIGVKVAKKLNMRYIDREIITTAAERSGVSESTIEQFKKVDKGFVSKVVDSLLKMNFAPTTPSQALRQSEYYDSVASSGAVRSLKLGGFSQVEAVRHEVSLKFPEARAFELIKAVVAEFARQGNCILAGSGSQMILQDKPDVLHVLILAPLENRIQAIMEQEKINREIAEKRIKDNDEARSAYIRRHFKVDWMDPTLYNLVIDTGKVPKDLAVDMIVQMARGLA